MKYFNVILFFIFFVGLPFTAFSQQDSIPITTIVEKNSKLNMDFPLEKVYAHFDKPYYAVGDTAWFKVYLTTIQNIPSPLSKIVYLDVITSRDSLVETLKLPVHNSVATGSISISHLNFEQGNYRVRAYTRWMLNFSQAYFFSHNLTVGNAINKELITHIDLTNSTTEKNIRVNAGITFKNEENKPLRNKKVSWEVVADYDRVSRGRGVTDDNGFLALDFNSSRNVPLNEGKLTTTLEVEKNEYLTADFPLTSVNSENDVQFFPEGGDLVAGLPSKVAFKAIRSNGLGIEMKGDLVDSEGAVITSFNTEHLGMGKLIFTPLINKIYFANITFSDGTQGTFQLPTVKAEGVNLAVDNSDPLNLKFNINANEAHLKRNLNKGFYIIGRNGGVIYYAAQSVMRNQVHTATVPKSNFPSGIVELSILASDGKVLSERLAFVLQSDTLNINVETDQSAYKSRQHVKTKLNVTSFGLPIAGNFSVSVIDESKVPVDENTETTILSSLLLTSDIEGYIEQPNYYFSEKNADRFDKLDLLMLTQGYRRYLYSDIISDKVPAIALLPEQALNISGVIRRSDGMPLVNNPILLQIPEKAFYKDGITDDKGRFVFSDLMFQDSVEAVVNARGASSSRNLMINVDGEPFAAIDKNINAPDEILNIDTKLDTYLENSRLQNSTGFLLKEVQVEGRTAPKPSHRDHSALTGLSMMADFTTEGDQLGGCNNLINCLSTVMGLTYVDNTLYLSRTYNAGSRIPAEIYVSGMPVDVSYLHSIQPSGIESIQVFLDDGMTGINQRSNTSGVVVINLKEVKKGVQISRQELRDLFPPSNILKFNPKGYSVDRVFYVPRYTAPRSSLQGKDNRSTVYWNPLLSTDQAGNTEFDYFTADDKGTYRVVVEGIDSDGHIGRAVYRYNVE